jgi:hypothetical protein
VSTPPSIALFIPYFGKWPDWIALYFESVRRNPGIDFHFFTDCDTSVADLPNVFFHKTDLEAYSRDASEKLGVRFAPSNAYKLCDLRPFFAIVHADIAARYDFFGWTDVDLLFGDIRAFYNSEILERYSVLSTHAVRVSGHLALLKNTPENRNIGYKIYNWKEHLEHPHFVGIDEHGITNALTMTFFDKANEKLGTTIKNGITKWASRIKRRDLYLKEQYTTPFLTIPWLDGSVNSAQPDTWFWKDGRVTNSRDGDRSFIYIHFMNFKSDAYRADKTPAPWAGLSPVSTAAAEDMRENGIVISPEGIKPLRS